MSSNVGSVGSLIDVDFTIVPPSGSAPDNSNTSQKKDGVEFHSSGIARTVVDYGVCADGLTEAVDLVDPSSQNNNRCGCSQISSRNSNRTTLSQRELARQEYDIEVEWLKRETKIKLQVRLETELKRSLLDAKLNLLAE